MTLTPRQRRHAKSSANSKHPFIDDEKTDPLDSTISFKMPLFHSTTTLKTPDVVAKMMALDVLLHPTTILETPDVAAKMMALDVFDEVHLCHCQSVRDGEGDGEDT